MHAVLTALVVVVVTACASSPSRTHERFTPAPPPPPGYATLYLYRGYQESGGAIWPIVYLNDVKVVDVKTYSYTYVYLWPGKYHLRAEKSFFLTQFNEDQRAFDFAIPSAGTYYLQFGSGGESNMTLPAGHGFVSLPTGEYGWFLLPESAAQPLLSKTFYQPSYVQTIGQQ